MPAPIISKEVVLDRLTVAFRRHGYDGASVAPFTAKVSRDDIVRANNGGYIGPAADY